MKINILLQFYFLFYLLLNKIAEIENLYIKKHNIIYKLFFIKGLKEIFII